MTQPLDRLRTGSRRSPTSRRPPRFCSGTARDDAARRRRSAGRGDGDGQPDRTGALHRSGGRKAPRRAPRPRGELRLRLLRGQPDSCYAARLREGSARSSRARRRHPTARRARALGVGAGEGAVGLRGAATAPGEESRAETPARRLLRPGRRDVRHPPRRLRAEHEDGRGARDLRRPQGAARPADQGDQRCRGGERLLPHRRVRRRQAARLRARDPAPLRVHGRPVAARPDAAPVHDRHGPRGHPADDQLPAERPDVDLREHARVRPRRLRVGCRPVPGADATRERRVSSACTSRRAEPGRTSSAGVVPSGASSTPGPRRRSRSGSAPWTRKRSTAR